MPSPAPTSSSFRSLAAQAAPPDRRSQPGGAPARVRRLKVRRAPDGQRIEGWVTNASVLQCVACRIDASWQQAREAELAAEWARGDPGSALREPPAPLYGHQVVEVAIHPPGFLRGGPAAGSHHMAPRMDPGFGGPRQPARESSPELIIGAGDRINLLASRPMRQPQPPTPMRSGIPAPRQTRLRRLWAAGAPDRVITAGLR